jgi:hypothetical protein
MKWIREKTEHGYKDITIDYGRIGWFEFWDMGKDSGNQYYIQCNSIDKKEPSKIYEFSSPSKDSSFDKAIEILQEMKKERK